MAITIDLFERITSARLCAAKQFLNRSPAGTKFKRMAVFTSSSCFMVHLSPPIRILRANLLEGQEASTKDRLVPNTVFIDPQLGRVGLSETEARELKKNIRVAKLPMTSVARAIEMSETRGFIKAIVDADTNQILGCSILGVEGGELMAMIEIAMMGRLPYTTLKEAIFAHPTMAESLNSLVMAMDAG